MQYLVAMTTHVPDGVSEEDVDDVIPLSSHPNDPRSPSPLRVGREFLTTFTLTVPNDVEPRVVDEARTAESDRARELAEQGHLFRLGHCPATVARSVSGGPTAPASSGPSSPRYPSDGGSRSRPFR